jgi:hypothetical protein
MNKLLKMSASIMLAASILIGPSLAQDRGQPVARVVKISEKGRLDFNRGDGRWFQSYVEAKDFISDQLRTDATTFGTIEFYTGGQIGINKNTTVEIVSENKVNTITLKSGGIWGKMATQKDPLQIRTSSGVMGIKGTEFVVTETAAGTEVSVLEGQVEVSPADGGAATQVAPGTQVRVGNEVAVVKQGEPEDLREQILDSSEWQDFNEALRWANYITGYIPQVSSALGNGVYHAQTALAFVANPAQEVQNLATSIANSYIPGPFSISPPKPKPDFPSNLNPDFVASPGNPIPSKDLRFKWDGIKNAKTYLVMVARDTDMTDLVWTGQTEGNELRYPELAEPLSAGKYFWRIVGIDKKGQPVGKASQTSFDVAAP